MKVKHHATDVPEFFSGQLWISKEETIRPNKKFMSAKLLRQLQ